MGLRVEISAGELVDKITILEIKLMFIEDEEKRKNISTELTTLKHSYLNDIGESPEILAL